MPTPHAAFCLLPLAQQMEVLWDEGTLLATRWEGPDVVELFQLLDGSFCEVHYQGDSDAVRRLHCFVSNA